MRWPIVCLVALLSVALGACVGPMNAPPFSSVSVTPLSRDLARIYFYRDWEPYETMARPWIRLNGVPAAISEPGGVSYRDVRPGEYRITVDSPGAYPGQFKTAFLQPGETIFVKIESLWSWDRGLHWTRDTFVVSLIWEERARYEMSRLHYFADAPSP